jgi:hypothetical protein
VLAALRSTAVLAAPSRRPRVGLFGLIAHPLLSSVFGHSFPAAPGFGLPCPTTLFPIGVLSLADPLSPRVTFAAPLL